VPYVRGFLVGVLLAILALYVEGYIRSERETSAGEPQKIANSDVAAQKLRSSLGTIKEEVHEATRWSGVFAGWLALLSNCHRGGGEFTRLQTRVLAFSTS
jgi:hypothetical protein